MAKTGPALTVPLLLAFLALASVVSPARTAFADRYGVAVIVGNRDYQHERVPDVAFAHRDAVAFRRYVLGVRGDRIQAAAFPGPLTSWERGLPARRPPEPPGFLRHRAPRKLAMRVPEDVLPLPKGRPSPPRRWSLEARGPGKALGLRLGFVRDRGETGGGPLLAAGSGASCEKGTFLASRGWVSRNGVRSFHIHGQWASPKKKRPPAAARRTASWRRRDVHRPRGPCLNGQDAALPFRRVSHYPPGYHASAV